jgi:hypothetical protein
MASRKILPAVTMFAALEIAFCMFIHAQIIGGSDLPEANAFMDVSFEKGNTYLDDIQINEIRLKNKKDIRITSIDSIGRLPVRIAILIDTSNSQKAIPILFPEFYSQIISSLHLRPIDSACLISFNQNAETLQGYTSDLALLLGKSADLHYGNSTRLFDVMVGSSQAFDSKENSLKAMIIITDGLDEASIHSDKQAYNEAMKNNVRVYMFLPADYNNTLLGNEIQKASLLHVKYVTKTGGRMFQSFKKNSQGQAMQIMDELSHLKRIRFYIEPPAKGELDLEISVSRKGVKVHQGAVVH